MHPTAAFRLLLLNLIVALAVAASADVTIVAPGEILHDADLPVSVTGLIAGGKYDLQSDFVTHGGSIWRSSATFIADAQGRIDLATSAPVSGSWDKADPRAFIWSMAKTKEIPATTSVLENDDQSVITVTVMQDGKK